MDSWNRHDAKAFAAVCTGTAIIHYPDGSWIDLELVITNHGREFRTVVSALTMERKPGVGEYRQQRYACGRQGRRLRNISRPSPR